MQDALPCFQALGRSRLSQVEFLAILLGSREVGVVANARSGHAGAGLDVARHVFGGRAYKGCSGSGELWHSCPRTQKKDNMSACGRQIWTNMEPKIRRALILVLHRWHMNGHKHAASPAELQNKALPFLHSCKVVPRAMGPVSMGSMLPKKSSHAGTACPPGP